METTAPVQQGNGMGTASMVLGIIGLVLAFIPFLGLFSWVLAPLAIIFGLIGISKGNAPKGQAIAGLATGGVALALCLLWAIAFGAALSGAAQEQQRLESEYQSSRSL